MQIAELSMKSLPDDRAIAHDHRADERIRTDPTTPALRHLKSSSEVRSIRACELGSHKTD
jgi:hypothetical protein